MVLVGPLTEEQEDFRVSCKSTFLIWDVQDGESIVFTKKIMNLQIKSHCVKDTSEKSVFLCFKVAFFPCVV